MSGIPMMATTISNVLMMSSRVGLKIILLGVCLSTLLTDRAEAAGNEARCAELGANCICSERYNSPAVNYVPVNGDSYIEDTATTTKKCASDGNAGAAVTSSTNFSDAYTTASSGEAIDALPVGHSVSNILRVYEGGGGWLFGHNFSGGDPTALRAMRFYKYYSSNYVWTGGTGCPNDGNHNSNKIAQLLHQSGAGGGPIFTEVGETWSMYAINQGWTPAIDCCGPGGPGQSPTISSPLNAPSTFRGKWYRFEVLLHNATTTGTSRIEAFLKNVTDDTDEWQVIDTAVPETYATGDDWTSTVASTLQQTSDHPDFVIDAFRNGGCDGWAGYSHFLAAAWSTDAGQRILAAEEIEGDGGETPTPGTLALFLRGLALFHLGGTGFFLWQRRAEVMSLYATSKEMVWMWRWKRAVKRWQAEAPVMLPEPVQAMPIPTQVRVEHGDSI